MPRGHRCRQHRLDPGIVAVDVIYDTERLAEINSTLD